MGQVHERTPAHLPIALLPRSSLPYGRFYQVARLFARFIDTM